MYLWSKESLQNDTVAISGRPGCKGGLEANEADLDAHAGRTACVPIEVFNENPPGFAKLEPVRSLSRWFNHSPMDQNSPTHPGGRHPPLG